MKASRRHANQPAGGAKPRRAVAQVRADSPGSVAAHAPAPAKRAPRDNRPKLTIDDAKAIRARWAGGEVPQSLADEYGVTRGAIDHVCQGRTFRSLGGPVVRAPKMRLNRSRWGKRCGRCAYCEGPVILAQGSDTRLVCGMCSARAAELLTVYDP